MTKVLIFLPSLWSGGGEKIAMDIAGALKGDDMEFLAVTYMDFTDTPAALLARKYGIRTVCLHKGRGFDPRIWFRLGRVIDQFKPDAIHAHLKVMQYLLPPLMVHRVPRCIYTVHNLAEKDASGYMRFINKQAFSRFGVIPVAISETCRRSLVSLYNTEPVCIYNGIDTGRYARREPYRPDEDGAVRFVAIGRLGPQKNYPLMLRAFAEAAKRAANIALTIIGAGPEEQEIKDLIGTLGLRDRVTLAGVVSDVENYLWQSQVYLMSSVYEGLPLGVLEAMSASLPIVSTMAGGVVDVVRDGDNGLLCPVGDEKALAEAITAIAGDRELRLRMSRRSLEEAAKYDIKCCAEQYRALYTGEAI